MSCFLRESFREAPPPEYTVSGGYSSVAAGGSALRPSSLPAVASGVVSLAWFPDSGSLAAGFAAGFHLSLC